MRRDDQPKAQQRWIEAQAAAGDIPSGGTYDFEAALIGQAASYAYAGEGMEGSRIVGEVVNRLGPEMARLNAAREISPGELVYANALAWKAAFRVQQSVRRADRSGYYQVGASTRDENGAVLCRGDFLLRPHPRFPYIAEGDWAGSTVLRLATNDQGQVIHAEVIAAVPPLRAFSSITLQHADSWRYRAADDLAPGETPCRLNSEGFLMPWTFG